MAALFNLIWDICCLRRGPQDLPYAPRALLAMAVLFLVLQQAAAWLLGLAGENLGAGVLSLAVNFGALFLLLNLRNLRSRFVQAATALLGVAMVFFAISVPLMFAFGTPPHTPADATPIQMLIALLVFPMLAWKLIVDAHVLRHSLDVPFLAGLAIAVLWLIAEFAVSAAITAPQSPA